METLKKYNLEEEEDKLFSFLLLMADEQNKFLRIVNALGYKLTNPQSMESLNELECYIREQNVNFKDSSNEALTDRTNCWYYLGEVVRKNFGGQWRFSMNEENTANWGDYVIEGHCSVPGVEFEPLGLVRSFTGKGCRPGTFRRAIMAHVEDNDGADFLADLPIETDPNDLTA